MLRILDCKVIRGGGDEAVVGSKKPLSGGDSVGVDSEKERGLGGCEPQQPDRDREGVQATAG
jgi:hypothetical protein